MTDRRPVRVDPRFLERLDAQLGEERGPNGEPSRIDFLRFELPAIEDEFALRFDELAEVLCEVFDAAAGDPLEEFRLCRVVEIAADGEWIAYFRATA